MAITCDSCHYPIWMESCLEYCDHRTHCDCEESQSHESPDTVEDYDLSCGRSVKQHAANRWLQRTGGDPPCDIGEAWEGALPVGSPRIHGNARYHPPSNLVLVAHGGAVRTALEREWAGEMETSHLVTCDDCGELWYPAETDECPWCDDVDADEGDSRSVSEVTPAPTDTTAPDTSSHACPVCGDQTAGVDGDDRCKVCRELDRGAEDDVEEDTTCQECFRDAEPGSDYCDFHSFKDGGELSAGL